MNWSSTSWQEVCDNVLISSRNWDLHDTLICNWSWKYWSYIIIRTPLTLLLALRSLKNCRRYAPPPVVAVLCSRLYLHRPHSPYTLQSRHVQHVHIQSPPELDASNSHDRCHKHAEHAMNTYKNAQGTRQGLGGGLASGPRWRSRVRA